MQTTDGNHTVLAERMSIWRPVVHSLSAYSMVTVAVCRRTGNSTSLTIAVDGGEQPFDGDGWYCGTLPICQT